LSQSAVSFHAHTSVSVVCLAYRAAAAGLDFSECMRSPVRTRPTPYHSSSVVECSKSAGERIIDDVASDATETVLLSRTRDPAGPTTEAALSWKEARRRPKPRGGSVDTGSQSWHGHVCSARDLAGSTKGRRGIPSRLNLLRCRPFSPDDRCVGGKPSEERERKMGRARGKREGEAERGGEGE
jgi:hypothetical protein